MMEILREQMGFLLDQGLHDSAEILGSFLLCAAASNNDLAPTVRAENMVLFADALYGRREYKRALNFYRQALQQCRVTLKPNTAVTRSTLSSTGSRPSSANSSYCGTINDNEVKYKIALCHMGLRDTRSALTEMEAIPSKARTLRINLTLAKLYRVTGYDRAAVASYRECLRQCPYVLEAIIALAELGIPAKDIQLLFPQTPSKVARAPSDGHESSRLLQKLTEVHCGIASLDYKGALENLNQLAQRFPNNLHVLLETGKVEGALGRGDEAVHSFEKSRQVDPCNLTDMDEYAMLLRMRGDTAEMNRLVYDLLNVDAGRPEVWVSSAVYWETRDDRVRALSYADKSIRVADRHTPAYLLKGNLSLSLNHSEAAVMAFRKAQSLKPDLRSYQGLVRSYLALSKNKEALCAAREAMKAMPHSAKALTLVGDVYAHVPEGREKARKFYESALRLEPGYLGAVLALADLHRMESRNEEATLLLQRYLQNWADDALHTKLAQILALTNKLGESLSHYQAALSINPQNEAARKGLERLEKQMKGVDPDALEEDEENEAEDGEGDPEEAEFL
ncbi:anaphase-promoting complex subunit 7 [Selaginella moellendorffii]|uniref:anaphase-promoting complex subunit 7 n=1 Tax=Selaginella moellendorffii TaxID=88036 RepID=UPI000D1CAF9B|nr:anaphase-promoting complex subunit 7 [Selaginella moellendorffii]|eukprot:XP_024528847.1 anaphase-promoting complex subunit 7 [Selaginella moellendorffii]